MRGKEGKREGGWGGGEKRGGGAGEKRGGGAGGSSEGHSPRGATRSWDNGRRGGGPLPQGALREIPGLMRGRAGCEWAPGVGGGLPPAVPVRRILMLEPFLRVPGFDISRQRSGSRGSSAAAPRPGPARPRRRRLKVTAPGWAPGSEPGHELRGPGVRAAGGWSSRGIGSRPGAPDPRSLPAEPSPEPPPPPLPPPPPPPPPQSRTPAALAASAAATASRSRARSRRRAGPALRAPGPCSPHACVRARARGDVWAGRAARLRRPLSPGR